MRRDCVTQVIVRWSDGEEDNFATPFEAENYINYMLDELGAVSYTHLTLPTTFVV